METPDPHAVLSALGEPEAYGGKPPFWEEAMAARPAGELPFLALDTLAGRIKAAGLSADRYQPLADMARTIASDPALSALAWYLFWRVFCAPEKGQPWGAPSLLKRLGNQAGLFYELLALEFPSRLYAYHRTLGYPPEVTEETIKQISSYEGNHLRGRSCPGIYERQFPWLATYLIQPYVRLGRLEYQLHPYGGGVQVWRRSSDGAVLALAEDGARVAANGLLLPHLSLIH
ncbi:MAG: acyltransferase domain-containing protein, partial [Planctomycetota bacterium]|nr:acyltransferase domain-containing protein [Planctomycetota bacterium]